MAKKREPIYLSKPFAEMVDDMIEGGMFDNANEVVEAALELLAESILTMGFEDEEVGAALAETPEGKEYLERKALAEKAKK